VSDYEPDFLSGALERGRAPRLLFGLPNLISAKDVQAEHKT